MITPITPQVGAGRYAEVTPVSSTCQAEVDGEAGYFAIDAASTASFHVIPNDGTAPFTCSLAGARFNCPDRAAQAEDLRPTVDAVLMMQASARARSRAPCAAADAKTRRSAARVHSAPRSVRGLNEGRLRDRG